MRFLEDLLSITAIRVKLATGAQTDSDPYTDGVLDATARAYADVAMAVAIRKHSLAASAASLAKISADNFANAYVPTAGLKEIADRRARGADTYLKAAEEAERVAHAAKARVTQLED